MRYIAIIPARYASTRFPGKPLAMLGGKPIIERVVERAKEVFKRVVVATDDERILQIVTCFGGEAVMTDKNLRSGTDRVREAFDIIAGNYDVVVNIQGDEPFIHAQQLEAIKACFEDEETDIATLVKPFEPTDGLEALENPNSPKVVVDNRNRALYFSRSVIPYLRNVPKEEWLSRHTYYKHIGLYGYRAEVLKAISALEMSSLESAESLEQLRWLENGYTIRVGKTNMETIGIDTPEDLVRAEHFLESLA